MVRRYVTALCSNVKTETISLHQWPQDPVIGDLLPTFVQKKRAGWDRPSKHSVLCSEHFEAHCFDPHIESMVRQGYAKCRQLLPDVLPTLWKACEHKQEKSLEKQQKSEREHG